MDEQRRPRAGAFGPEQAEEAIKRVKEARLVFAPTDQPELAKFADELAAGDLSKPKTEMAPVVARTLYERLLTASGITKIPGDKKSSAKEPKRPTARIAPSWEEVGVGDLVLAQDPDPEYGWYEAVVLEQTSDRIFRVQFRDYPDEGEIIRSRDQLALLPPA